MRVNVSLRDDIIEKVDKYAEQISLSRSAFIAVCCTTQMNVYNNQFDINVLIEREIDRAEAIKANAKVLTQFLSSCDD